ncbi:MAG: hypothetical protein OHK0032_06790 [Thermodesulfovibrionales bacterium]
MRYLAVLFILIFSGSALSSDRGHRHEMTPEMERQHETMHHLAGYWSEAKGHLSSGDLDSMTKAIDSMLKAAMNIPEFRLHRNADKHGEFQREFNLFKNDLERLRGAIISRDIERVRKLSESVDEACTRCHNKFR